MLTRAHLRADQECSMHVINLIFYVLLIFIHEVSLQPRTVPFQKNFCFGVHVFPLCTFNGLEKTIL